MSIWSQPLLFIKGLSIKERIVLFCLSILVIVYFIGTSLKGGDFATFLEAATKMVQGKNIYAPPYINLRYSYSPFWAFAIIPLALLPAGYGAFIWLCISLGFLFRTIFLLKTYFRVALVTKKADRVLWILILMYMARYIELNFHHVQMTIFLLWLILESVYLVNRKKEIRAGILIGLGTIIKIMPVVMIPYFIFRGRFVAAVTACLTVVATFYIPILYVGSNRFFELNHDWFSILRPDSPEFQIDAIWHFPQNLSALLYRLLVDTGAPYSMNILSLTYPKATNLIWIVVAVLIFGALYFLNSRPFKTIRSSKYQLYEVSYIVLLIPLIFPHQMKYAFYFVLPAVSCLFFYLVSNYQSARTTYRYRVILLLLAASFCLCTLTTDLIIGMKLSTISQHLKTITLGTLLLIPALAMSRQFYIEEVSDISR